MKKAALVRSKNISATEVYYDIIASALKKSSSLVYDGFEESELPKDKETLIVCGGFMAMARLWARGYRKIVTWYQGAVPEESFMRNKSWLRKTILSSVEKFSLRHSVLNLVVSKAMMEHFSVKYKLTINNSYVMPCYNTEFHPDCYDNRDPKSRTFVYAGSLSKWQCIEQMLQLYKSIEDRTQGKTNLLFLTSEVTEAVGLIEKYKIRNYEVKFVHYSALAETMRCAKFGFALREDIIVNRVATPTKLANYVADGIIPIYTTCVRDFYEQSQRNPFQIAIQDANQISEEEVERIIKLLETDIDNNELRDKMHVYFDEYYNTSYHISNLRNKFSVLL